tara:strand:+ start:1031 stop:1381 length:351 start_codon:yes stop_codon:yes gene_type:complete
MSKDNNPFMKVKLNGKQYDLENHQENTNYWTDYVNDKLLGRKIVKVEYMSTKEANESMWCSRPIAILLDDGKWIYPMRDDEGNDGGAMGVCGKKGMDTYPVLSLSKNDKEVENEIN